MAKSDKKEEVILLTGGFDPVHSGHLSYIKEAKKICSYLILGINSDDWLIRKKHYFFMPWNERKEVLLNLKMVDEVISFNDNDGSAIDAIRKCLKISSKVIFANGGDRERNNIPEFQYYNDNDNVKFIFGIGGSNKNNSSSLIVKNFLDRFNHIDYQVTPWGRFSTLHSGHGYKVKLLSININEKLSLQFHKKRSEQWIILKGNAAVHLDGKKYFHKEKDHINIPINSKHRIENISNTELIVLEANFGDVISEEDIIRLDDIYGRQTIEIRKEND